MNNKDKLFLNNEKANAPFKFDKETVSVFNDMINRSVPYYQDIQNMVAELTLKKISHNTDPQVIDLGCSLGTTIKNLASKSKTNATFIGMDYSQDMLTQASENLKPLRKTKHAMSLKHQDLNALDLASLPHSDVILSLFTLQFIKPANRPDVIKKIYKNLKPSGYFIYFEKITTNDTTTQTIFETNYHAYKQANGYSLEEIENKKKALAHSLFPQTLQENLNLITNNGFSVAQPIFQWYNFSGILAIK